MVWQSDPCYYLLTLTSKIPDLMAPTQESRMQMSIQPRAKWLEARYLLCSIKDFSPELCHLKSTILRSPCFHPPPWDHVVWKYPQFQFISLFCCFLWLWQMRLGHEMGLLELSMQDDKAGTNKSHLSLFTGEVWEQPHYTVARINLGPLSLPFTLGAWYNVLQGS